MMMRLLRELAGLFVDDGWLAVAILAVVALAGIVSLVPGASLADQGSALLVCRVSSSAAQYTNSGATSTLALSM